MLKPIKQTRKLIVLTLSVTALSLLVAFKDAFFDASKNLELFASVYKEIHLRYVDPVNSEKLIKKGIDAMLQDLDPYTEFVPESEMEDYKRKYVNNEYGGIGTVIKPIDNRFFVYEVIEGFPADKAGLLPGDEVLKIDSLNLAGREYTKVSTLLRGLKNTRVNVLIKRGTQELQKTITRQDIKINDVSYYGMLDNGIAYIKLDRFLSNSAAEVRNALVALQKQKPRSLVLDLRSNGGGIVQQAVKITGLFLKKGSVVVTQKGRSGQDSYIYRTAEQPIAPQLPLVVLINEQSASASEIVAGALQDMDRAVIIGRQSFGKGLVQQSFNLPYNSLVKITTAKYYTPSGRCLQALDYSHRGDDNAPGRIPDSLLKEYRTDKGRLVYNGRGVYPDVVVNSEMLSPVARKLVLDNFIFQYATTYYSGHPSIGGAKSFSLDAAGYQAFVNYMQGKDYTYDTPAEVLLGRLKEEAQKEKKFDAMKAEYEALKARVSGSKQKDFAIHKEEIKRILESEIVSRYHYQKGRIEHSFQYDPFVKAARGVLGSHGGLNAILTGSGVYKTIGKPVAAK